jgi:hypothetical protein
MVLRLTSSVLVGALIRRAESEGGFGAIVAKGDGAAGAIAVILRERGRSVALLERTLQPDGCYAWQASSSQEIDNEKEFSASLERKRRWDPDLWIVELDIASAERFAAEMNALR